MYCTYCHIYFTDDEIDPEEFEHVAVPEGKIGAKKMRKLQEKEEKKRMLEVCKEEIHDIEIFITRSLSNTIDLIISVLYNFRLNGEKEKREKREKSY